MARYQLIEGELPENYQQTITAGFSKDTESKSAPAFKKSRLNFLAYTEEQVLIGALTADLLWDWIYIDELWVDEGVRGTGLGKELVLQVEEYARTKCFQGIWLWTQSWQAAEFYRKQGYDEFAVFPNFPKDYERIGFRKMILK